MPEPETTPPACETGDVRTCTMDCPEHGNPDACGAACSEQHTYRLNECALACKEIGGGVADRSWTVPCSLCGTKIGFPCYDTKSRASGISHGKRWDAYDRAEVAARRAAKASPAVPVPGLRDQIAGAARHAADSAYGNTPFIEAITDAVLAIVQPAIDEAQAQARRLNDLVSRLGQTEWQQREALTRVRELHHPASYPNPDGPGEITYCVGCDEGDGSHPCPTIAALAPPADQPEGGEQ